MRFRRSYSLHGPCPLPFAEVRPPFLPRYSRVARVVQPLLFRHVDGVFGGHEVLLLRPNIDVVAIRPALFYFEIAICPPVTWHLRRSSPSTTRMRERDRWMSRSEITRSPPSTRMQLLLEIEQGLL